VNIQYFILSFYYKALMKIGEKAKSMTSVLFLLFYIAGFSISASNQSGRHRKKHGFAKDKDLKHTQQDTTSTIGTPIRYS